MTLPASGPLSMSAINTEFGRGLNLNAYRGTVWYTDAGASGTFTSTDLGFNQFYSKRPTSPTFAFSITTNQTNADLRSLAVSAGWNQSSQLIATINGGVYISSNSTGTAALTITGSFPQGVTLVNNGFIVGMGGNGGAGAGSSSSAPYAFPGAAGTAGGTALNVTVATTVNNASGTIAGGGGGGGGGSGGQYYEPDPYDVPSIAGGGGGGGGRSSNAANTSGGAGGIAVYNFAKQGTLSPGSAGSGGTVSAQGGGGAGGGPTGPFAGNFTAGAGGAGGGWGTAGATGGTSLANTFSGGPYGGGGGGNAVTGNGNISWTSFGTRLGGIS